MASKYPALYLLGFVITGITIANLSGVSPIWFFSISVCFVVAGLILFKKSNRSLAVLSLMVSLGCLSGFHFSLEYIHPGQHDLSYYTADRPIVRIFGEMNDWPDIRANRIELKIEVDSILKEGQILRTDGSVLLKISDTTNVLQRGDRVDFRGRIYPLSTIRSSGRFDYGRYLNLQGVRGIVYLPTILDIRLDKRNRYDLYNLIDQVRASIVSTLTTNLEPTQAALARGFLIGETRDIPPEVYKMFRDSGTLHLLAVSGSNVSLVLLFMYFLLRPFKISHRRKGITLLVVVVLFTQLAYGEPSVVRASVMASLIILAGILERRYDLNHIIATAALVILLVDPAQLFDVGFQLSFVTAWGLILTGPILTRYFAPYLHRWYGWILTLAVMSFSAQLFSMPIVAYHFERIPAISVLANLVIVPLVSVGVIGILVLLVAHLILPALGLFVGGVVNPLLKLVVTALVSMGGDNMIVWKTGSLLSGPASIWVIILIYLILITGVIAIYRQPIRKYSLITGMVVLNILLAMGLIKTFARENQSVLVNSIPGGVVVSLPGPEYDSSDLIISGGRPGSFSVGEMILTPWLDRHDINRVKRIFVINTCYDCLPDLFEFASERGTTELYFAPGLRSVVLDQFNLLPERPSWEWEELKPIDSIPESDGLFLIKEGLIIRSSDQAILISRFSPDKLYPNREKLRAISPELGVIFPYQWKTEPKEWNRLNQIGLTPIICSEIEQQLKTEIDLTEISPDLILPDFLIDLKQFGPVKFDRISGQIDQDQ